MKLKSFFAGGIALTLLFLLFIPAAAHPGRPAISSAQTPAAAVHQVDINTGGFNPGKLTIVAGESVNWTNHTSGTVVIIEGDPYRIYLPLVRKAGTGASAAQPVSAHSIVTTNASIAPEGSYSRLFLTAGIYHFYLKDHPTRLFLLTVTGRPDLETRTLTFDLNPAAKDSPLSLQADIYNIGSGNASAFSVSWKLIPLGQTTPLQSGSWDVSSLAAGGHTLLSTTLTPSQAGPFIVQVTADPAALIADVDLSNNTREVELGVTGRLDFCGNISSNTTWAFATYVLTCNVSIDPGVTLTIRPGTVVKFQGTTAITVNGALNVPATQDQPAYFTSIQDDTVAGDTNGDGSGTSPAPGDWNSLIISSTGTATLSHANIRYGGWYWCGVNCYGENTSLHVMDGGSVMLDYATFAHNNGYGILVNPSSTSILSVTHSTIATSALDGIRVDGIAGKDVTITNNVFTNNGSYAVSLAFNGGSIIDPAGNSGSGNATNGIRLSGTLGMDITLPGNASFPYVVDSGLTLNATRMLTLSAGAIVKFGASTNGTLTVNGVLVTFGTDTSPVIFTSVKDDTAGGDTNNDGTSSSPAPSDWNSIIMNPGSAAHLTYANIRYGGYYWCGVNCYGEQSSLHILDGGSATLDYATFSNNGGYGILVNPSSTSHLSVLHSSIATSALDGIRVDGIAGNDINIANNAFTGNGSYAVALTFSGGSVGALGANLGSDNATNGIRLSGTLGMDTTLSPNPSFPYVVDAGLTVNPAKTLTLPAATVVKFGASTNGTLTVNGSLVVNGTDTSKVIFTSLKDDTTGGDTNNDGTNTSPAPGDWNSIIVSPGASVNLTYPGIRYGGYYWCGVNCYGNQSPLHVLNSGSATLDHASFSNNNGYGIYVSPSNTSLLMVTNSSIQTSSLNGIRADGISGKDTSVTNNTFTGNGTAAVSLAFSGGSVTNLAGNSGSGNAINGIQLSGNLGMDTTLPGNDAFAYIVDSGLTVDTARILTLSSGAVVKFGVSTNGTLVVNGNMTTNGTSVSPVIFTSLKDDTAAGDTNNDGSATTPARGDWNAIVVSSGASTTLTYTDVRYGGFYWCGVSCYGYNTQLFLQGNASILVNHSTIHESNGMGLSASGNSATTSLTINDSTIADNNLTGIDIANAGTYILTINRTAIRNNTTGVNLTGSSISATVNHCNIHSNSSLGLNNGTASTVDATLNWWGSDTGPAPYGSGNGVSGIVTVSPWLTALESLP